MILRYDIPHSAESMVELSEGERIYYAVPIDIDEKGNWTDDSYFVVTTSKLYIIRGKISAVHSQTVVACAADNTHFHHDLFLSVSIAFLYEI